MKRFFLACLLLLAATPAFAQTVVAFSSPVADWIGQGETKSYTTSNSYLSFFATRAAITVRVDAYEHDGNYWNLSLVAPVGEELAPGEYFYAERASFVTGRSPGLEFTGSQRGCNRISGRFSIRQIKFDANGSLSRLEAVALQSCDGLPPLALEVRYRASYYMFGVDAPPGWLGMGQKVSYYNDTTIFNLDNSSPNYLLYRSSGMGNKWDIWLSTPPGKARFTKGTYYTHRFAEGAYGQLDVTTDGRGCNVSSGVMNVLEVVYGPGDRIDKFYGDFSYYCESIIRSGPPLKGRIRYVRGI